MSEHTRERADVALSVDRAMTEAERHDFLEAFVELNPRWRGAKVADVLSELDNADSLLMLVEAAYERYGDKVPEPGLLGACVRAVAYAGHGRTGRPYLKASQIAVLALVERVRAAKP